jgi:ClpP class serine protease
MFLIYQRVFVCHYEFSGARADAGIKPTYIFAGEYKVEGNSTEPLGSEAKAFLQSEVNATHTDFVKAVARGRGTSTQTVRMNFGKGRCFGSRDALKFGMIDAIAPPDEAMQRIVAGTIPPRSTPSAAAGYRSIIDQERARDTARGEPYRQRLATLAAGGR